MSEMVERVGAALRAACLKEFGTNWNNDVAWEFARAAIAAMREPTPAMLDAAVEAYAADTWKDMINTALQEDDPRDADFILYQSNISDVRLYVDLSKQPAGWNRKGPPPVMDANEAKWWAKHK
jgi:hypothetical protein